MRVRSLVVPLLALLPALLLDGAASGQQYPPSAGTLVLSKTQVRPGESLTASGDGCRPNTTVNLEFRSPPVSLGTTQANGTGGFSMTVTIPADASPGAHSIVARCVDPAGGQRELTGLVDVLGVEFSRGPSLPRTGAATLMPMGIAGAGLLVVGVMAVLASRRRRALSTEH